VVVVVDMDLLVLPNEVWIKILSILDREERVGILCPPQFSKTELLNFSLVSKKAKQLAMDPGM
jgi:hypothetical protein